jgi:hypothetical protein
MSAFQTLATFLGLATVITTTACGDDVVAIDLEEMSASGFTGHAELQQNADGKTLFPKVTSWVNLQGSTLGNVLLGGTVYSGTCDLLGARSPNSNYVGVNKLIAGTLEPAFESLILGEMESISGERFSFVVDAIDQAPRLVRHVACGNIP